MRGTKWFMIGSDGAVLVNHIKPTRGPAAPQRSTEIGKLELAVSLPNERFSLRCPSSKLSDLYGLDEIGRMFNELRAKFPAS